MSQVDSDPGPTAPPEARGVCVLCHVGLRERYRGIVAEETGTRFDIVACPECGLGRTRPVPADLGPYYRAAYYGNRHGLTARLCIWRRLRLLRRWAGPGAGRSLLDFGCGDGAFLRAARREGWEGFGVERHRPASVPDDVPVVEKLDELPPQSSFDCATFWHVFEHLDDPVDVLRRVRGHLKPGGLVLAAVPNFGSWQARVTGASWLHLDVPRHHSHFTAGSLTKTLEAAGFQVRGIAYGEWEYDVIGWSQGLLNRVCGGRNEFFKAMSGRPAVFHPLPRERVNHPHQNVSEGPSPRQVLHVALGLGLSALAAVPAWVEARAGRGGTLIVAARSPEV